MLEDKNNNATNTAAVQATDAEHHLHPFTNTGALNKKGARVITKGEGVYLWDSEGHKILDGMAGLWCVNMGYGRKELVEAATKQMNELAYYNTFFQTTHTPAAELGKRDRQRNAGRPEPYLLCKLRLRSDRHHNPSGPPVLEHQR